ncbi:MAG: hypothetical protein J4F31_10135 [Flavobacteriales bacterium]|nr:hypothetical protein [Flavobacteriales bacterium]
MNYSKSTMTLEDLGYTNALEEYRTENGYDSFDVGRVVAEHKERYVVKNADGEYDAEILGNLRYTTASRADFPAVGDWVALSVYDEDKGVIHAVFPGASTLERRSVGARASDRSSPPMSTRPSLYKQ